ncbi:hypothetical protein [Photobacterium galatheae]|uniref:DUF4352 domain-containing protein n=1 Tax=Photobacterium galatheae TaxID=1654360 RepID=A0A066RR65_9GAMM|nr:hypothetical protein [Photobacterium galatheae]KDM92945.1 hypothetical protein EA58_04110 [Photobacterium galatheae]MCM0148090.1 hypothetical protein [Photobacterium galatheae]
MKKLALLVMLGLSATNAQAEVKETITDMTRGLVKFTKEISSGVTEGFKEGRSSTESADGSVVVTNEQETLEYIEIDVLSVAPKQDSNLTVVEMSFRNKHNKPVKITGLSEEGALLTIDKEGFSHSLSSWQQIEFTVPNEAAKKYSFTFSGEASQVKQVRVWHKTYEMSADGA